MGPTRDFGQTGDAGRRLALVEIGEAGVAAGVQVASIAGEQRMRVLRPAVGRVAVEGGGRRRGPARAFVAHGGLQLSGLGSASPGIEHRNRGVVWSKQGAGNGGQQGHVASSAT